MTLFEIDYYKWVQEQTKLIKEGRFSELDMMNLIEEIEGLGKSEESDLDTFFTILLEYLLRWQYQFDIDNEEKWKHIIWQTRNQIDNTIDFSPSLESSLNEIMNEAYEISILRASRETDIEVEKFPPTCPWTLKEVIDNEYNFFPEILQRK